MVKLNDPPFGYDINTGEPIYKYENRMVHVGNGFYDKACNITQEDLDRRKKFFASLELEVAFKKNHGDE